MKGLRTILIGALMTIVPPLTEYIGAIDWDSVVGSQWGFAISGIVMIALRFITSTPIFSKDPE